MFSSIGETVSTLRESKEAIREGRIAIDEARLDLRARYNRAQRRLDRVDRGIDLLRQNGPDTDLRDLLAALDGDRNPRRVSAVTDSDSRTAFPRAAVPEQEENVYKSSIFGK